MGLRFWSWAATFLSAALILASCVHAKTSTDLSREVVTEQGLRSPAGARISPILDCSKKAGTLVNPQRPAGTADVSNPIEHVIVIMQENHSFDAYFGRLNQPQYYGSQLDGVTEAITNPDKDGNIVHAYHETNLCIPDTDHMWNAEHSSWDGGKNDGFVATNGARTMAFYDQTNLPFYYELANQFAVADRYFCSAMTSTYPNRYFLMAGTAFGHYTNDEPGDGQFTQRTIFDVMTEAKVSWKYYTDSAGYLQLFKPMWKRNQDKMASMDQLRKDMAEGTLPQVTFIDAEEDTEDEHPDADVQIGQEWVAHIIHQLVQSPQWSKTALFLTYDENGGFADHVAPPKACAPDDIAPNLPDWAVKDDFSHYGFRVPFVLVSPYAKHHFVSHRTYDHTSILKFIETKFNLPALTVRDANADGMMDLFDFKHPIFTPPILPSGAIDQTQACHVNH